MLNKGDKVAIISKNQNAIHHFFDVLSGTKEAPEGSYSWGTTISKAYLPLDISEHFQNELNLMDWLRQYVPASYTDVDEVFLRGYLGRMLFSGDEVMKKCKVLSGGEKVRSMLSMMMLQNPNVLLLDEPTNHLDLESIQAFNENMIAFNGIVLINSHDHTFCKRCVTGLLKLHPMVVLIN